MKLVLNRIDDRLIHGQVATSWARMGTVDRIIVVDDKVAQDELRVTLLKQAAPQGIASSCVSVDKFKRVYDNPKYKDDHVILLFTNPQTIIDVLELGVEIDAVNVGNMGYKDGKTKVTNFIFLDEDDVAAFEVLSQKYGVKTDNRIMADSKADNFMDLLKDGLNKEDK